MTPVDLAAIETLRRLLEQASPAPWTLRPQRYDDWGWLRDGDGDLVVNTSFDSQMGDWRERQREKQAQGTADTVDAEQAEWHDGPPLVKANAALIAHLRNLAPALLDERQRLIDRIAALEQENAKWSTCDSLVCPFEQRAKELEAQLTAAEQGATALRAALGQEARTFFDKYVRISDRLEQTEHVLAAVVEAFAPIIDSTKGDGKSNWRSVLNVLDYKDVGKVGAWTLEQLNALELPARQAWEVAREALSSPAVPPSPPPQRFPHGGNAEDHAPDCQIKVSRDGWDAPCTCGLPSQKAGEL